MQDGNPTLSHLAKLALASAAETADADEPYANLPRLLRYALSEQTHNPFLRERVYREIMEIAADLGELARVWVENPAMNTLSLAAALDAKSVQADAPALVSLANSVRLLGLVDREDFGDEHRKVTAALAATASAVVFKIDADIRSRIDEVIVGWALLAARIDEGSGAFAVEVARSYAHNRLGRIVRVAVDKEREALLSEEMESDRERSDGDEEVAEAEFTPANATAAAFVQVCAISDSELRVKKLAELIEPHKHCIGVPIPLTLVPNLAATRDKLLFEFPYARGVIDRLLEDLVGRETIKIVPTVLVGLPGSGKSRFTRRVAELLGVGLWRVDASTADGAVIGGTARRWHSAEPCHGFLAISRARCANPIILIDEVEKAGTRSDYGRLWDSLLGLLEPETAARYPDPALQTTLDLSHISYLATANSVEPLPAPLRDRFRVINFPTPGPRDIGALMPSLIETYAVERGLDRRWFKPLNAEELDAVARAWTGGSVRNLQRYIEVLLHARDMSVEHH